MIYSTNTAIHNSQHQARPVQLLNSQKNLKQPNQPQQKHIIYRSQNSLNMGGQNVIQQQGAQIQEIAQQPQFAQHPHKIQYQHGSNASFFGNQNQIISRSVNGPISSLQQQLTNSLQNNSKENNNQVPIMQNVANFNYQQQHPFQISLKEGRSAPVIAQIEQKNKIHIQSLSQASSNSLQSNQAAAQLQPINRQEQQQASKASFVNAINSQSFSSQNLGQPEREQNIQFELSKKGQSSSFYQQADIKEKRLQNSFFQQNNQIQAQNQHQSQIQQHQHQQQPIFEANSQSFIDQTIPKQIPQIITQQDQIFQLKHSSQLTPQSKKVKPIDIQQFQTLERQYQGFIPISTSSPQAMNDHLKFSLQIGSQNQLSYSTYTQQNYSQPQQQDPLNYVKLENNIQKIGVREISPYEKLIQARRSSKEEDHQNKSYQSLKQRTSQIESIKEENIMSTPRKQAFQYSNEISIVSDIKSTNDTEFREKASSQYKFQNIITTSPYQIHQSSSNQFSPKQKLHIKEKRYGNEDLCNFYPVTHIQQQDLQRYDLILKCTLQTQNQSIINQKIKDFSDGFQFSAY